VYVGIDVRTGAGLAEYLSVANRAVVAGVVGKGRTTATAGAGLVFVHGGDKVE